MEIEQGWGRRWEMAKAGKEVEGEEELPAFCISPARQNLIKTEKRKLQERGATTWLSSWSDICMCVMGIMYVHTYVYAYEGHKILKYNWKM